MLQRAASNAYSWWWASHIRTKQSKWLEQNLQDMEEKVGEMLKIIDDDGDSFAQRAEMYYKKRPELINFVEDCYRSYRAIAERYDHLSKDLQSANRTIATVFPEQVQFAIDAEDEENQRITSSTSNQFMTPKNQRIPKVPAMPKKDFRSPSMVMSRKGNLKRSASSARAALPPSSGLSKDEAFEQMDTLQKGILALQTEKEFVKSSYEHGFNKYWEIENRITEMQAKVCSLQDEFGIGTVIDDNEARTLMAATALKSCQDTLAELQEQQEQSVGDARLQYKKIIEAHEKFANLRNQFLFKHGDQEGFAELKNFDSEIRELEQGGTDDVKMLREKIKKQLGIGSNKSLTVSQLAEKVDEIVEKVVTLETGVSSQAALVKRLISETDHLHEKIRSLEEEKESLLENVENMRNKLIALEEELRRLRSLKQSIEEQNKDIQTQITEANCNIDHLCDTLQSAEIVEEAENAGLFHKVEAEKEDNEHEEDQQNPDDVLITSKDMEESEKEEKRNFVLMTSKDMEESEKEEKRNFAKAEGENFVDSGLNNAPESVREEKNEKKYMSETASSSFYFEQEDLAMEDGEDTQNWRQLANGLEDRDKIILEEYTAVLRNYQEVKRKLSDVEKKNRDGFIELALQIRELENAVAFRDAEIQSLHNKLNSQTHMDENMDTCQESITQETVSPESNFSPVDFHQQPTRMREQTFDFKERVETKKSLKWDDKQLKVKQVIRSSHVVPTIEDKVRSDIDELLEENLEFWLRFSTTFHQIQKFQTAIQDLRAELTKMREKKMEQEGNKKEQSTNSEARPIYKHLREIQTELTLWLENNAVLKDELHGRYSSLCSIQDEISRVSSTGIRPEETELSNYQAAKFQGEVINMKQENRKISGELEAGLTQVKQLRMEVEKTLAKLEEELTPNDTTKSSSTRTRIPLRSFLFGVKLKRKIQRPSLFSCLNPALQKQYSSLAGRPL